MKPTLYGLFAGTVIGLSALLLFLCKGEPAQAQVQMNAVRIYNPQAGGYLVTEFRLDDGTRCVARGQSIACDWRGK